MKTKTTLAALLLAAVMVTPSYGWDAFTAFIEKNQIEDIDNYLSEHRGFYSKGFDDFEGYEAWRLIMLSEESDENKQCMVSVSNASQTGLGARFYCVAAVTLADNQAKMYDYARFKTDLISSPKAFHYATGAFEHLSNVVQRHLTYQEFQEMFTGNKLEFRFPDGKHHTFNINADFVHDALGLSN